MALIVEGSVTSQTLDGAIRQVELRVIRPNLTRRDSLEQTPGEQGNVRIKATYPAFRVEGVYDSASQTLTYAVYRRE